MPHRRSFVVAVLVLLLGAASAAAAARPRALAAEQWQTWWGTATIGTRAITLSSQAPQEPAETHSALLTSAAVYRDHTFSFTTTTLEQLREGSAPNTWEVGWAMFRFRDLENYYYFILKTNGWELGKKHGSDAQIFLATGEAPRLVVGRKYRIQIRATGARIQAFVGGVRVVDFTDPNPLLSGSVGLYEEDARVRFESVSVSAQ